jgi:spore coat protein U-like protein
MRRASFLAVILAFGCTPAAAVLTCSGSSVALSLGVYDSYQATALDASTVFTVTCNRVGGPQHNPVTVGIGPSANSGTVATRRLKLTTGSDTLNYNLYRDAGRQMVWGNTPGIDAGTQTISVPNNGSASVTFTLFGRIDALQEIRPGNYTDALTVTVTF